MKVGYAVLYEDGTLVISKKHTILQKPIYKDYGEFDDTDVPWAWGKDDNCFIIVQVWILDQVKSNCMKEWFADCLDLTTLIDFQNLDVSDCKDFSCLFYECQSLKDISSLKNWNVSNGMDFAYMFDHCESLMNISALANWNVVNGKDFSFMFYVCESLQNINGLQNWDVSNGEDFSGMFSYCVSLKEIHLPDTLCNLKANMFKDCNSNLKIHWKGKIYTYEDLLEYKSF